MRIVRIDFNLPQLKEGLEISVVGRAFGAVFGVGLLCWCITVAVKFVSKHLRSFLTVLSKILAKIVWSTDTAKHEIELT